MNRKVRILTVSSANMDFVMNVQKVPDGGETTIDPGTYSFVPGGKGANSAVAIQRLGGESIFCTRLGNDQNGSVLKSIYINEGIDTRFISIDESASTGLASIMVEPSGQNRIIVFPGANLRISDRDIQSAMMSRPDALLMQLEISAEAVISAAKHAHSRNIPVFIDAGPADADFPLDRLPPLEVFSPNETETKIFTGIDPKSPDECLRAAIALSKMVTAKYIVLKLGGRGCYIYDGKYYYCLPTYDVPKVDTTAAGDSFTAALTLEYMRTGNIAHAGKYANAVGSLVISKHGALPSIPTESDVQKFVEYNGIEL